MPITAEELEKDWYYTDLSKDWQSYMGLIVEIANAYLEIREDLDASTVLLALCNMTKPSTGQELKDNLIAELNSELKVDTTPVKAQNAAVIQDIPKPPSIEKFLASKKDYKPKHDVDSLIKWLNHLRGRQGKTIDAGRRMVAAAEAMNGWFTWTPSGPLGIGDKLARTLVAPHRDTDLYRPQSRENAFAAWVTGKGGMPGQAAAMNCWEAVLFTAFKAGLLSRTRLIKVHGEATDAALRVLRQRGYTQMLAGSRKAIGREDLPSVSAQIAAAEAYYEVLSRFLGMHDAVRLDRRAGSPLRPRPGDILFFGGRRHVAIYMEREWQGNSKWSYQAMSLWNIPRDGFRKVGINSLLQAGQATFRPCPFPA